MCWSISMINVKSGRNGWWTVYAPRFGLACHPGGFQRTASGGQLCETGVRRGKPPRGCHVITLTIRVHLHVVTSTVLYNKADMY